MSRHTFWMQSFASAVASGAMVGLRYLDLGGNPISDKTKGSMRTVMSERNIQVDF